MLISRAAASSSTTSLSSAESQERRVNERQRSLHNSWLARQRGIRNVFESKRFLTEFACDLSNSSETAWVKSSASIDPEGVLQFQSASKKPSGLGSVNLQHSIVVGHLSKSFIQISTDTKIFLLLVSKDAFEGVCATSFSRSRLRPAGVNEKLWIPPVPPVESDAELPLLRCGVMAFFTEYHPERTKWAHYEAYAKPNGELVLSTEDDTVIYSIQISKMRSSQIKMMDPSVVNSDKVLMLFPDYGGPETVYLKFDESVDYGDWVATLKALGQQEVASPSSRDPSKCIRWNDSLTVKVGTCEKRIDVDLSSVKHADLSNTYVEICSRRWSFARTSVNKDAHRANWCQSFESSDPETDQTGLSMIELKLRSCHDSNSAPNAGEDKTISSVELSQWDSSNNWQWLDFPDTDCCLNVNVVYRKTPVLDSSYYAQLQKHFDDISLRAASRVVHAFPSMITDFFPLFNQIYRAQGRQLEWILNLASEEIENIDLGSDVLFRGSSLFTRIMELLLQQEGKTILERTIGRFIRKMKAVDKTIELDPKKSSDELELKKNRITMDHYLRYLWPSIRNEGIPDSAKKVFRHMALELSARGRDEADIEKIMNRTLAAFLFLRFYGPALVNPQKYGLIEQNLDRNHSRTLVLVAKALQGFANRVRFGSKESWLLPMNDFINDCEPDLLAWYGNIYKDPEYYSTSSDPSSRKIFPIHVDEPPPKELPVETFMGQQSSSPNLVDEYATYSQFANIVNTECHSMTSKVDDESVDEILSECHFIVDKQTNILKELEQPDTYEESCNSPAPSLYFNSDASLFGLSQVHLDFEPEIRKTSSFSESITKLARIPKARSTDVDTAAEDVKPRPGSVKKLMDRFRITRATSPN